MRGNSREESHQLRYACGRASVVPTEDIDGGLMVGNLPTAKYYSTAHEPGVQKTHWEAVAGRSRCPQCHSQEPHSISRTNGHRAFELRRKESL